MLLTQLLTVVGVVLHIGNKGYIYKSLKDNNFKTSKTSWKKLEMWNKHIVYPER